MKQMSQNAYHTGEIGITLLVLSVDQIINMTKSESGLRDGFIELPVNDCSMELMADIATVKSERESEMLTVEQLEREVIGLSGKDIDQSNNSYDLAVTRQLMEEIYNHNHIIQEDISTYQRVT